MHFIKTDHLFILLFLSIYFFVLNEKNYDGNTITECQQILKTHNRNLL